MNTGERINLVEIAKQLTDTPPTVDPITEGAISYHELCRSLSDAYPMHFAPIAQDLQSLQQSLQEKLLASGAASEDRAREIPTVPPEALNDSDFAEFIKAPCPVILKGAARDTQAVRNWSPSFFGEHYGSFPCVLATETDWNIRGTLGDAVDDILTGKEESRYAHNIANIFNEHPDLEAQLELDRFLPHLGPGRHLGTHLFIGGSKTGTAFHCANNLNVFFNIYGEKDWFFVHPKHAFWMYGVFAGTRWSCRKPDRSQQGGKSTSREVSALRASSGLLGAPEPGRRSDQSAVVVARHRQRDDRHDRLRRPLASTAHT